MLFANFAAYQLIGILRDHIAVRDSYLLDNLKIAFYQSTCTPVREEDKQKFDIRAQDVREALADLSAIDILMLRNILNNILEDLLAAYTRNTVLRETILLYVAVVGAVHEQVMPF